MRTFQEIYDIAALRKGGSSSLETLIRARDSMVMTEHTDDRWLACMTKCIFCAGFNWNVVEAMWPGFEAAFDGFDVNRCAMLHDEDFDRLVSDKRIVRHGQKIKSVQENAVFLLNLARDHGSADAFFRNWPTTDLVGLLDLMKKQGTRIGGNTGQYLLRFMGKDTFLMSQDVVGRLVAEGVVDKAPSSAKSWQAVQEAFNTWAKESGRSMTDISRVLAMSVG